MMPAATPGPPDGVARSVEGCREAHTRLLATLEGLDDETARKASALPGWTVGHVVVHLARNADSLVRMLTGAAAGRIADQYEGGPEGRAADIAAGAGRPAGELLADLAGAIDRLEATWRDLPAEVWTDGVGRMTGGELCPCADLPSRRWREVEVHRVDLGLGPQPADWPVEFVELELPRLLAELPGRLSAAERTGLLAWLMGRADRPPILPPW